MWYYSSITIQRFCHRSSGESIRDSRIITGSYYAAMFTTGQNCLLSLFTISLRNYCSSFGFFTFVCLYIYMTFVWVRISRILAEALGTLEETISVSFPLLDPYQSPKSLHCIRKNKPCIRKIILVLFWSNLNKHQCLKYYSSKFLNLSKWISIISLYILY